MYNGKATILSSIRYPVNISAHDYGMTEADLRGSENSWVEARKFNTGNRPTTLAATTAKHGVNVTAGVTGIEYPTGLDLINYLEDRADEPCAKSVPERISRYIGLVLTKVGLP